MRVLNIVLGRPNLINGRRIVETNVESVVIRVACNHGLGLSLCELTAIVCDQFPRLPPLTDDRFKCCSGVRFRGQRNGQDATTAYALRNQHMAAVLCAPFFVGLASQLINSAPHQSSRLVVVTLHLYIGDGDNT